MCRLLLTLILVTVISPLVRSQTLSNPGFAPPYNTISPTGEAADDSITGATANGWGDNSGWGHGVKLDYEEDTQVCHSGTCSQRIDIRGGFAQFGQFLDLPAGPIEASVWVKSSTPLLVSVTLREGGAPYTSYAEKVITSNSSWAKVTVTGFAEPGHAAFLINTGTGEVGSLWIDDAAISKGGAESTEILTPPPGPIPLTYFGLHPNHLYEKPFLHYPDFRFGTVRTLNCASAFWAQIEPNPPINGVHSYVNLKYGDDFVSQAAKHHQQLIFTFYMTPSWATDDTTVDPYGSQGGAGCPRNFDDFAAFVSMIAKRYPHKIAAFEVWNEPDCSTWDGTPEQMATMEAVVARVVHRDAPGALVISPPVSSATSVGSLGWLDHFMTAGGGSHSDIIGQHLYSSYADDNVWGVRNLKALLAKHHLLRKPIWDTEQGYGFDGLSTTDQGDKQPMALTIACLGQSYVLNWAEGVSVYNWYMWNELSNTGVTKDSAGEYTVETAGTDAYLRIENWMLGARMLSCSRDSNGIWTSVISRKGGYKGYILWNRDRNMEFTIPNAWHATDEQVLNMSIRSVDKGETVTIGAVPILLETGPASQGLAR